MTWTTARDLEAQLARLWERGVLLRAMVDGFADEPVFPLRLTLKGPTSADLTDRFAEVRAWSAELLAAKALRFVSRDVQHRVQGAQRVPAEAWVDSADDAWRLLDKRRESARFADLVAETRRREPALLAWVGRRPLQALALADEWPRLLDVVSWLKARPRPGVYLRQVDLPGVHSKFIEAHRAVLAECFDLVLPPAAIDTRHTGVAGFAARYGFRDKPARVRLRVLDASLAPWAGAVVLPDLTLDAPSFAALRWPVKQVFITENEVNFLAFPPRPASIVIFGAGYGWDALADAAWLAEAEIHHWGDIDTHGFAILDQLRAHVPHARSLLMDAETLLAHRGLWGEEPSPIHHDLPRLMPAEQALYDDLRDQRLGRHVRLEQERVGFGWVEGRLRVLG